MNLRLEHTHFFADKDEQQEGGHYHYDMCAVVLSSRIHAGPCFPRAASCLRTNSLSSRSVTDSRFRHTSRRSPIAVRRMTSSTLVTSRRPSASTASATHSSAVSPMPRRSNAAADPRAAKTLTLKPRRQRQPRQRRVIRARWLARNRREYDASCCSRSIGFLALAQAIRCASRALRGSAVRCWMRLAAALYIRVTVPCRRANQSIVTNGLLERRKKRLEN